ncbi:MAG: SpoIIIAH-like family protein [bacterium]|nr:SpoIIIAH-like family protein [bacterium]
MLIKKKEIVAAALVVLIGCAGYLNWSYQDTLTVRDGESYIETGKRLGEAQLVNSEAEVEENENTEQQAAEQTNSEKDKAAKNDTEDKGETDAARESNASYFENAKYERENARSKSMEILNQTCSNNSFDEETRRKAGDKIIAETQNMEAEHEIESIAQSKGYNEICAYVHDEGAVITVRKDGFSQEDAVKLTELTQEQTGIQANNIKVVNVN